MAQIIGRDAGGNPVQFEADARPTASGGGGAGSPWVAIASGRIAAPVPYFDVALPGGYIDLRLVCEGFVFSAPDLMAFAASNDGGAAFYCDPAKGSWPAPGS